MVLWQKITVLVTSLVVLTFAVLQIKYPHWFINMPFYKGVGGKAYWNGLQSVYGRERAIEMVKSYGKFFVALGLFFLLFMLYEFP